MIRTIRLFMGLALCFFSITAQANTPDDTKLYVVTKAGGEKAFNLSNVKKIVFQPNAFTVVQKMGGEYQSAYTDVVKFCFAPQATGITNVATTKLAARYNNGTLYIDGWNEGSTNVALYDVSGCLRSEVKAWNGGAISVGQLPKGLYLMRVKNYSIKIMVK